MATLALTATAIGVSTVNPALGLTIGLAGGILGGYLDQRYIYPALFGDEKEQIIGPGLKDIPYQGANAGQGHNYCLGPFCRTTGTVIWLSGLITETATYAVQGKGGGDRPDAPVTYRYYKHGAVAVNDEREINDIERIYADGKIIYLSDSDASITNSHIICGGAWGSGPSSYLCNFYLDPQYGSFADFVPGFDIDTSGFSNSINNGTWNCWDVRLCPSGPYSGYWEMRCFTGAAQLIAEDPAGGYNITIDQSVDSWKSGLLDDLTIYKGTSSQTPDSLIESIEGSGNVPGWRRRAYIVFDKLKLTDFGNRFPQIQVVMKADSSLTVAQAIGLICERQGLTSSQYDTTGVEGDVEGYVIRGPQGTSQSIQPLLIGYDIITQERNGKIYFFKKSNADLIEIDFDKLGVRSSGSSSIPKVTIHDAGILKAPTKVEVKFFNLHNNGEQDSVSEMVYGADTINVKTFDLQMVMCTAQAKAIAKRLLWEAQDPIVISTVLSGRHYTVLEGDRLRFTDDNDEQWTILITKRERRTDGTLYIEGISDRYYDPGWVDYEEDAIITFNGGAPNIDFMPMEIGPLKDEHARQMGLYFAAVCVGYDATWRGCAIYESIDGGSTYEPIETIVNEATMGITTDALGGGVSPNYWDNVNTVTVLLFNGTLESCTQDECRAGMNRAVLMNSDGSVKEVIGFTTATLESGESYIYELSGLLRGLRDTADAIDSHTGGEKFVLLNASGVIFHPLNARALGQERYYKAVPAGYDEADYTGQALTLAGGPLRPFTPWNVQGSRDGSNNLTITWTRRSRAITRLFGPGSAPLLDGVEKYEIDILDGATVVRTIEVEDSTTATYTAAQQTADGLTPGDPVDLIAYQISPEIGRGKGTEETV